MPVYLYKNLNTGETFEVEQRITESALTTHPESGEPVKRLIQPVGIAFKGSGFYVTDSRSSGGGRASAGSASEGGSGKAEGGSDGAASAGPGDAGGSAAAGTKAEGGAKAEGSKAPSGAKKD